MPSISLVTVSKNGGERLKRLLKWASPHFDEIIIYVDTTTTDGSREEVVKAGATLVEIEFPGYIDRVLQSAHDNINTDWGLHLDDDELMGVNFEQHIQEIMDAPNVDVVHTPRYNLCKPGYYIYDGLRYPDWQLRLFRKGHIHHPGEIHEGAVPIGGTVYISDLNIFHFSMMDYSYDERVEKWRRYISQGVRQVEMKRGLPQDYYKPWCLFEDFPYQEASCDEECSVWSAVSS